MIEADVLQLAYEDIVPFPSIDFEDANLLGL
jgi:hypothetical protein